MHAQILVTDSRNIGHRLAPSTVLSVSLVMVIDYRCSALGVGLAVVS